MNAIESAKFAELFAECWRRVTATTPAADPTTNDPAKVAAAMAEAMQKGPEYPPLEAVTSEFLTTASAAYYLNRRGQTLRWWNSQGCGPIRPVRRNGRLAWRTDDVRKFLRGEVGAA